jgi:hypothetical protein
MACSLSPRGAPSAVCVRGSHEAHKIPTELPALLGVKPVRSELVYLLVSLDKEYTARSPDQP